MDHQYPVFRVVLQLMEASVERRKREERSNGYIIEAEKVTKKKPQSNQNSKGQMEQTALSE